MKTINDYRKAFLELAGNCKKEFGANRIAISIYESGEVKFVLE